MYDNKKIFCILSRASRESRLDTAKLLFQLGDVDIHTRDELAFISSCRRGYLDIAKWLYQLGVDIHAQNDRAFRVACSEDNLNVAKWLYQLGGVAIHAHDDFAFRVACYYGHDNVAEWLLQLGDIDTHFQSDVLFLLACRDGHSNIAKLLIRSGVIPGDTAPMSLHDYYITLLCCINVISRSFIKYKEKQYHVIRDMLIDNSPLCYDCIDIISQYCYIDHISPLC